jgi:thioredoxin-related protein
MHVCVITSYIYFYAYRTLNSTVIIIVEMQRCIYCSKLRKIQYTWPTLIL